MRLRTTTTLLLVLVAAVAIGCGSEEKKGAQLPADSAAALDNQLTSIQNRFNAGGGACRDITGGSDPNTRAVDQIVGSLPDNVDKDLRSAVQESFDHLFDLTDEQCDQGKGQQTTTESTPAPAPETTTAPPQTETTTTPTTPTQTEQQPPQTNTEKQTPPGQGGENPGQGNGNQGQGGGNGNAGDGGALVPGNIQ